MNLPSVVLDDLARLSQTPQDLLRLMTEADEIRWKVQNKLEDLKKAEEAHTLAKSQIEAELGNIRRRCRHNSTRYHGDPAGGSDSHTECLICRAWFRGKDTTSGEER